ncbi:hypothetical protein LUZ60_004552 [Juncus effusus]|nr:hypothetical protein LUZ60_004552 [Juncus effusus]
MPPILILSLALTLFFLPPLTLSLSTISISHLSNITLICAFIPSQPNRLTYNLTCTGIPTSVTQSYTSEDPTRITESYTTDNRTSYSAIASGNGFLCAVGPSLRDSSNISTMRWWDFTKVEGQISKIIYQGPPIKALSAGDSHMCGIITDSNGTGDLHCWRWPELMIPEGSDFADVAVGGDFVCGLVAQSGKIRCFGDIDSKSNVTGFEPNGSYVKLAAGTHHACAVSNAGQLVCWGARSPKTSDKWPTDFQIGYLALGKDLTCILSGNGMVECFGKNSDLPSDLRHSQFVAIQARGDTVCGVLMANYSLVCWGNKTAFGSSYALVFDRVLPGPCQPISTCPCGLWAGTSNICPGETGICHPCEIELMATNKTSSNNNSNSQKGRRKVLYLIIGLVGGFLVVMVVLLIFVQVWLYGKNPCKDGPDSGRIHEEPPLVRINNGIAVASAPTQPMIERRLNALMSKGPSSTVEQFPLKVLLAATDGFSQTHKIGSGSFGSVYRARLPDGREVAIKRAAESSSTSAGAAALARRRQDRESAFISELTLLSRVNHKNLVRLYGFCIDRSERVLVYEYMEHGNLHDHLHKTDSISPAIATWHRRLKLALDAARGIEYLHTYAVPPIIHRDIKSTNILLDASWVAKVADFGLSLLRCKDDDDTNEPQRTAGTVGYMDPEYYRLQHLTDKSDVYSFGVVLLELLSGCKAIQVSEECGTPTNIVEFAVPLVTTDGIHRMLDKRLPPPTPTEIEAVSFVGYLAADCVAPSGRARPTMSEVVCALERAVQAIAEPVLSRSITERSD